MRSFLIHIIKTRRTNYEWKLRNVSPAIYLIECFIIDILYWKINKEKQTWYIRYWYSPWNWFSCSASLCNRKIEYQIIILFHLSINSISNNYYLIRSIIRLQMLEKGIRPHSNQSTISGSYFPTAYTVSFNISKNVNTYMHLTKSCHYFINK